MLVEVYLYVDTNLLAAVAEFVTKAPRQSWVDCVHPDVPWNLFEICARLISMLVHTYEPDAITIGVCRLLFGSSCT